MLIAVVVLYCASTKHAIWRGEPGAISETRAEPNKTTHSNKTRTESSGKPDDTTHTIWIAICLEVSGGIVIGLVRKRYILGAVVRANGGADMYDVCMEADGLMGSGWIDK